jgi:glycosyltransferase involved in cell wall biosynthesis
MPPPDDAGELELTVLLPCLNEAETIGTCIEKAMKSLSENGIAGEVLVADNGSSDRSREIAEQLGARVVRVERKGYGAALLGGIAAARGRFVIMGDADDSYDFANLMPFVTQLRAGRDLVMGNRFRGGIAPDAMPPLHRYLGNPVLTALGRLFFKSPAGDFHCGLRGFRRAAIDRLGLKTTGMEFASEMVVKATLLGLSISEVPTTLSPDGRSRAPHLRSWRDGWRHLRFLLLNTPVYLFLVPGAAAVALGILAMVITMAAESGVSIGTLQWQPVFAGSILLIIGTNALMIGMASHLYAASRKIIAEDALTIWFNRVVTLERMLLLAGLLVIAGLGVDALIFYEWVSKNDLPVVSTEGLAAVAQTVIVIGANLAMGGFLTALMDER